MWVRNLLMEKLPANKVGRPTVVTPNVIAKLEELFKLDYAVERACDIAGISADAFYDQITKDKDFADKMAFARNLPNYELRQSVFKQAKVDGNLAFKVLVKTDPDFKDDTPKVAVQINNFADKMRELYDI